MDLFGITPGLWKSAAGEKAASVLSRHWTATKAVLAATFLAAGAHDNRAGLLSRESMAQTTRTVLHIKSFGKMIGVINGIDDIVDNMTAEERLALGDANIGNTPSEFLQSPAIGLTEYFGLIQKLDASKVISATESISFGNIYSQLLREGAEAEILFQQTGSVGARETMTESNMQIAQVLGAHILHHFVPDAQIRQKAQESALTASVALQAYPEAMRLGYLIEMCDDLGDFFTDMEREVNSRILTPNWFATDMVRQGTLYEGSGQLNREMFAFLEYFTHSREAISFTDAPEPLQLAVENGEKEMLKRAATLPAIEADAIMMVWNSIKKAGLKSSHHPDVAKKSIPKDDLAAQPA